MAAPRRSGTVAVSACVEGGAGGSLTFRRSGSFRQVSIRREARVAERVSAELIEQLNAGRTSTPPSSPGGLDVVFRKALPGTSTGVWCGVKQLRLGRGRHGRSVRVRRLPMACIASIRFSRGCTSPHSTPTKNGTGARLYQPRLTGVAARRRGLRNHPASCQPR